MSHSYKQCEAHKYSKCYGYDKEVNVIYKYRYKRGGSQARRQVKVCLCQTHLRWLNEIHQGRPLEMRGETVEDAMEEDLFRHFDNKVRMYTLLRAKIYIGEERADNFFLINGRDVDKFRKLMKSEDKEKKLGWIYEEGFFQICLHNEGENSYKDAIVEVVDLHGELTLEALAKDLTTFYKPTPDGEMRKISSSAMTYIYRVEENPTLDTEYTLESIPDIIRAHFSKKQQAERFGDFKQCCDFIDSEVDKSIINWQKLRENSSHTEQNLFDTVYKLTNALNAEKLERYAVVSQMMDSGELSEDVLWATYIMANHELYASHNPNKNLYKNTELIDLFVIYGLDKDLLTLAISGERLRWLSIRQRDHHDILEPNEFVVEYLMPKYITGSEIIYKSEHAALTPIEYWHYFINSTTYFGGGFSEGRDNTEYFDKNENIRMHLEKYTPNEK
uniref:Uncharacterized protein n=1 Tax=viral metagenome TaxID=1070528 RepID=A0A6C0IIK5_9ZZZZ